MTRHSPGESPAITRRALIAGTAAAGGAALVGILPEAIRGHRSEALPAGPQDPRTLGQPTSAVSARSPFETPMS